MHGKLHIHCHFDEQNEKKGGATKRVEKELTNVLKNGQFDG